MRAAAALLAALSSSVCALKMATPQLDEEELAALDMEDGDVEVDSEFMEDHTYGGDEYYDEYGGDMDDLLELLAGEVPEELLASLFGDGDASIEDVLAALRPDDEDHGDEDHGGVKLLHDDYDEDEEFPDSEL